MIDHKTPRRESVIRACPLWKDADEQLRRLVHEWSDDRCRDNRADDSGHCEHDRRQRGSRGGRLRRQETADAEGKQRALVDLVEAAG